MTISQSTANDSQALAALGTAALPPPAVPFFIRLHTDNSKLNLGVFRRGKLRP